MARSISLKWGSSNYRIGMHDGVRVRIEVTCTTGITPNIFAYRMLPVSPDGDVAGHYSHVCSPVDLEEYPAIGPRPQDSPQWFRLAYIDVVIRSLTEMHNFIAAVQSDVSRLRATLEQMDQLRFMEEITIGEPCVAPSGPTGPILP